MILSPVAVYFARNLGDAFEAADLVYLLSLVAVLAVGSVYLRRRIGEPNRFFIFVLWITLVILSVVYILSSGLGS
ncbi:MAG: hypothetical protein AAGD12_10220 [Pseudomonadota bacterium]